MTDHLSSGAPLADPDLDYGPVCVSNLLADPAVTRHLRAVLLEWLVRDPVDAARDAELLAAALGRRAGQLLEHRP